MIMSERNGVTFHPKEREREVMRSKWARNPREPLGWHVGVSVKPKS